MITMAFALLGAILLGAGILIGALRVREQMHPEQVKLCCPPLPAGQHFTGCTDWWTRADPRAGRPPHSHVYFGQESSARQPCEWCDTPASARAVAHA